MKPNDESGVEVKNLCYSYGRGTLAISDVSFMARAGEILGLVGPNGAGKTTLLRIIAGLIVNYSGTVKLQGQDVQPGSPHPQGFVSGLVDSPGFLPYLTGRDNLALLSTMIDAENCNDLEEVAIRVGISDFLDIPYGSYSHGMRQRLGIAACLLAENPIVLLDEPLDGLDPLAQIDIRTIMTELANAGRAVVFSSHRLSDVERVSTRLVLMHKGNVIKAGRLDDLVKESGTLEDLFISSLRNEESSNA